MGSQGESKGDQGELKGVNKSSMEFRGVKRCQEESRGFNRSQEESRGVKISKEVVQRKLRDG